MTFLPSQHEDKQIACGAAGAGFLLLIAFLLLSSIVVLMSFIRYSIENTEGDQLLDQALAAFNVVILLITIPSASLGVVGLLVYLVRLL